MNNGNNYPSCIKIPTTSVKQNMTISNAQKTDIKEILTINNKLLSLANRTLGKGKWSHTITSQTIDFTDSLMGKYITGVVTFVKIQLDDGTFHESMGYCHAEGATKGSSIHSARVGSLMDAFKNTLSCFGSSIQVEVQKLIERADSLSPNNVQKEDAQGSSSNIKADTLEPNPAPSVSSISHKTVEQGRKTSSTSESISRPKSPNEQRIASDYKEDIIKLGSPKPQKKTEPKDQAVPQTAATNQQKEENITNAPKDQEQKKSVSEEELLRMERKRKQMEKQAEYKRLMMEKEQQKLKENKKPNPKY